MEEEFDNFKTAEEVTQFLRGEFFIYVDSLLANTGTEDDLTRDEMREVVDFLSKVFSLIIKWLDIFPTKYMKYFEVYKKHKKTFLVDTNVAVAASGHELINILENCFGEFDRIEKHLKNIKLTAEEEKTDWYFEKRKDCRFRTALVYEFGKQEGFEAIIRFCNASIQDTMEEGSVPLVYVNALLDSISHIVKSFQNSEKKESLITDIKKIIISQVDNITDADIEKLEISQLNNLLEKLKHFGGMSDKSDKEMEETMELKLCHKLLKCPIFERRRQGMVNLITIIETLEDDSSNRGYGFYKRQRKQYEWLTSETLLNWVKDEKIIEYVYGEYSHPEIIRKSGELLVKMCQYELFSKKEIDIIWSVFDSNYHEDIKRAALDVIEMIVKECDEATLDSIRKRIHKLKKTDFDPPMITFMKSFILAEMENFYRLGANKKSTGITATLKKFTPFGGRGDPDNVMTKEHVDAINKDIELLWKLPSQKGVPEPVRILASKCIPEILSDERCSDKTKEKYLAMTKKSVKSGDQIYNNLVFIKTFLVNLQHKYNEIYKINQKYEIMGLILLSAEAYMSKASKCFKEQYDYNNSSQIERQLKEHDPSLLWGKSHKENIGKMFEIIQYLIEKTDHGLPYTTSEIEKMFQIFVSKRISNYESEMLFDLISGVEKNTRGYNSDEYLIKDVKVRKAIFTNWLWNLTYVTPHDYSPKSIRCFKDMFLALNDKNGKLELDRENTIIRRVKDISMDGIDTLWEIALQASNPIVQERAGYLLALIHYLYMDGKKHSEWEKETSEIVKYLMDILKSKTDDQYEALNHAKVLKQFIDTFEYLDFPDHFRIFYKKLYDMEDEGEEELMDRDFYNFSETKWNRQSMATFEVQFKINNEFKYVSVNIKDPVIKLKKLIAEQFGVKAKDFEIITTSKSGDFVTPEHDWDYVYELIKVIDFRATSASYVNITYDPYEEKDIRERSITYSIAEDQNYISILWEYLKRADIPTSLETINIIGRLPVLPENQQVLKQYIDTHKIKKLDHWYAVLQVKFDQPEEILMKMSLLESLLTPQPNSEMWVNEAFINNDGIAFLIDIIVQSCTILISDGKVEKFPLWASLVSRTLKLFSKVIEDIPLENILNSENTLILIKSGLEFLEYMSEIGNNNKNMADLIQPQLENDRVIRHIFDMFTKIIAFENSRFKTIYKHKRIKEMIFYFLIDSNRDYEKGDISMSLISLVKKCNEIGSEDFKWKVMPGDFFINIMHQDYLPIVLEKIYNDTAIDYKKTKSKKYEEIERLKVTKCNYYFDLFADLIRENKELEPTAASEILQLLLNELKSMKRVEISEESEDSRLSHLINLTSIVFKHWPEAKDSFADKELFNFVLKDCIFRRRKEKNEPNFPICKSDYTRDKSFQLLMELMNSKDNKYFSKFAKIVTKWMQSAKWRTSKHKDWELRNFDKRLSKLGKMNSTTDYIGLENMGCTWYMNAVVQQLFMLVPFRQAIQTVQNQAPNDDRAADTLYHAKLMFASLLNAGTSYHNPEHFFRTIKDIDGSDLNPLEQKDADEFLSRFLDLLEPQIKGTSQEKKIRNIFYGSFANQTIGIECPHRSENEEAFSTISLQVKNKHSLQESLDSFIESEIMQGDNAYAWEKWEKKVSAKRLTCMKKLPNIMIIALKRFEIDYETMQHNKINERVEFPFELKMDKYTDKYLAKADLLKEMEENNWGYSDLPEDKKRIHDFEYPEEYYSYSLRGVVVHMGEANSGHYYSYIKDAKNGNWYEFNDTVVSPFDPADMPEKAFGGEYGDDNKSRFYRYRGSGLKAYNGYMLLYERNYYIDSDEFMEKVEQPGEDLSRFFNLRVSRLESNALENEDDVNDEDVDHVVSTHNEQLWESKQLFSNAFAKFWFQISKDYSYEKEGKDVVEQVRSSNLHDFENLPKYGKHKWVSTFHRQALTIIYFHSVYLRSNTKTYLKDYTDVIRHSLSSFYPTAFFYIENFCKSEVITEFITFRKLSVLRMLVPYFVKLASKTVYEYEEEMLVEYWDKKQSYGDNAEKLAKHFKGRATTEIKYEDVTLEDHKGKTKTVQEWIVTLFDNDHEIPLLVIFANKLMSMARDFYEDISQTNKYHALVNFFELFNNLAEAGPEIKRYMIQNKFIGRLLDIYNHKKSDNRLFMRDLSSIPLYELICNGKEPSNSSKNIRDTDSMEENKAEFDFGIKLLKLRTGKDYLIVEKDKHGKEKSVEDKDDDDQPILTRSNKEGDEKRFSYLLRTITQLVCSCRFSLSGRYIAEDSLFLNTPNPIDLPDTEVRIVQELYSDTTINTLVVRSNHNITTKEWLNAMFAHLSWENDEATKNLLDMIIHDLCNQDSTFVEVIKHSPLIMNLCKIRDSLTETRMTQIIDNLFTNSFMEESSKYVKYSDSILNLILQMIKRNVDACRYIRGLDDPLKYIEKFSDTFPIPKEYSRKHKLFRKISDVRIDRYLSDVDVNLIREYNELRLQQFKELISDIDYEEHIEAHIKREEDNFLEPDTMYYKDDQIDYYKEDYKFWITCQVLEDYGSVLQVSYNVPTLVSTVHRPSEDRKSCVKINKDWVRPNGMYTEDILSKINCIYECINNKEADDSKSSYSYGSRYR